MAEIALRYGCNPNQKQAKIVFDDDKSPLKLLNGSPSYINVLDVLGAYQLARELKIATGIAGAASFKHVSPAGAAIAKPLDDAFRASQFIKHTDLSPVAQAYARARGGDRMCSFGDVAAVSETVDASLAKVLKTEVSDALIAPGYDPNALEILKQKKKGNYVIWQIDPDFEPDPIETRKIFGINLEQERNSLQLTMDNIGNVVSAKTDLPEDVKQTILVAGVSLKYTQSNSVCVAYDGQVIGMGAGQQSRIHCTRLACSKADKWFLQQHPRVLELPFVEKTSKLDKTNAIDQYLLWDDMSEPEKQGLLSKLTGEVEPLSREDRLDWIKRYENVVLGSDAFIPFRDNIDRASMSGVNVVWQTGGAARDDVVTDAANQYGMVMVHSGTRLFLH